MLKNLIENAALDKHKEKEKGRKEFLRLSSSGGCLRKKWYVWNKAKPTYSYNYRGAEALRVGNVIHEYLQTLIKEAAEASGKNWDITLIDENGEEITVELDIGIEGIKIPGHIDGLLDDKNNKKKYIIEIKTMKGYGFSKFCKGEISDDYLRQATSYMHVLGADATIFIAYNKEDGGISQQIVEYDSKIMDSILDDFRSAVTDKEPAPIPYTFDRDTGKIEWQCAYCCYNKLCWPSAISKVNYRGTSELYVPYSPKSIRSTIPVGLKYSGIRELGKKYKEEDGYQLVTDMEQGMIINEFETMDDYIEALNRRDNYLFSTTKPKECLECDKFIVDSILLLPATETKATNSGECKDCCSPNKKKGKNVENLW